MTTQPLIISLVVLMTFLVPATSETSSAKATDQPSIPEHSLTVVRGGLIVDGTGAPAFEGDVWIRGRTIEKVTQRYESEVPSDASVIDAQGRVVAPGFIDPHSHGDPLVTPAFENFLAQGVTTITLGQDGSSPVVERFPALFEQYEARGLGVNVALFVGHGSLRAASSVGQNPDPSSAEIEEMATLLEAALDYTFGMSSGLEYNPGLWASEPELIRLAKAVGSRDRVIMSHLRSEDDGDLDAAIDELIRQGEHAKVHIAHIKSVYGRDAARGQAIIEKLTSARAAGVDITADFYPYIASYTSVSLVFPVWAKTVSDFEQTKTGRRGELLDHLRHRVNARNGPAAMLLADEPYTGLTLEAVAEQLGKPFEEVLVDDLGPGGGSAAYFVMNKALQSALLKGDMVMVGSDGSPTGFHPRGHGTVARVIEQFVMADQAFSLEEAVKKMTSMPAAVLGLSNRGSIAPGKVADLVIFDPSKVKETATFANPHQLAQGFDWVLIGGEVARREGQTLSSRHGKVLLPTP